MARRCPRVDTCGTTPTGVMAPVSNFNPKSCNLIQKCLFHCENIPVAHVHARTIFFLQTTKLHDIMQKTGESRRIQGSHRSSGGRCSNQKGTFRNSFPFSQFKTMDAGFLFLKIPRRSPALLSGSTTVQALRFYTLIVQAASERHRWL